MIFLTYILIKKYLDTRQVNKLKNKIKQKLIIFYLNYKT